MAINPFRQKALPPLKKYRVTVTFEGLAVCKNLREFLTILSQERFIEEGDPVEINYLDTPTEDEIIEYGLNKKPIGSIHYTAAELWEAEHGAIVSDELDVPTYQQLNGR